MSDHPLEDGFRRRINYLRVSVTDRCNLRCTYCMPEAGVPPLPPAEILSNQEILRVTRVAVALGIRKVRITGGEPLVRRGIQDLVSDLAALTGVQDLSLTTNGLLLAEACASLKAAGLQRVNVSLDTLKPEVFLRITRRPGLDRVLAGIDRARGVGLAPVKVNVVALRGVNDGEILGFAEFAQAQGVAVRFIEFMPANGEPWEDARLLSAGEILAIVGARYALVPEGASGDAGPSRSFRLPGGGSIGVISPLTDHFCGTCNRLRLTAEGKLRSCLFSDEETDLRGLLRGGADDEELARAIRTAATRKPQGHRLGDQGRHKCGLAMNRVGG